MAIAERLAKLEADLTVKQEAAIAKLTARIEQLEEAFLSGGAPAAKPALTATAAGPDTSKLAQDIRQLKEELLALRAAGGAGVGVGTAASAVPRASVPTIGGQFDESIILTLRQMALLSTWSNPGAKWRLVYRASRDGDGAGHFHNRADGLGPTIAVLLTHDGYVIGGHNPAPWSTSGVPSGRSPAAFIFELTSTGGTKYPSAAQAQFSCFNERASGPCFGGTIRYHQQRGSGPQSTSDPHDVFYDIHVANMCRDKTSVSTCGPPPPIREESLRRGPTEPPGQPGFQTSTGQQIFSHRFHVQELEVFVMD
jgi:hypothetical protein